MGLRWHGVGLMPGQHEQPTTLAAARSRQGKDRMPTSMPVFNRSFFIVLAANASVVAVLWAVTGTGASARVAPPLQSIDVVTFNTEYWHTSEIELLDRIESGRAHIVFLQEHLEKRGKTWGPTNRIAKLKQVAFGDHVDWNGEVVTLSKWPIVGRRAFSGGQALRTDVRAPDGRILSAYNVHLPVHIHPDLLPDAWAFYADAQRIAKRRQALLDEVVHDLSLNRNPRIVAGDFNSTIAMHGVQWFRNNMLDAYGAPRCGEARETFELASGMLGWRIDFVYVSADLVPERYCTRSLPDISDHSAILARVGWRHSSAASKKEEMQ
jgi:endonuclease/exonuclease/phosphatase (EEP) superfamily protein YafD